MLTQVSVRRSLIGMRQRCQCRCPVWHIRRTSSSSSQAPRSIGTRARGPVSMATIPSVPTTGRLLMRWCIVVSSRCVPRCVYLSCRSASHLVISRSGRERTKSEPNCFRRGDFAGAGARSETIAAPVSGRLGDGDNRHERAGGRPDSRPRKRSFPMIWLCCWMFALANADQGGAEATDWMKPATWTGNY